MSSGITIPRRIYHWINLISIVALSITGWYIHKPYATGNMNTMRNWHFIFMYVFSINLMLRVYYAFFGKNGDWRKYLQQNFSKRVITATMRHYLKYEHFPSDIKDRILQNSSYVGVVLLFGIQIVTGIMLYYPESQTLAPVMAALGGQSYLRTQHFFFMWIFLAFTVIHFYMAISEDWDEVKNMFFGIAHEK